MGKASINKAFPFSVVDFPRSGCFDFISFDSAFLGPDGYKVVTIPLPN
jgi:hypothetical protein